MKVEIDTLSCCPENCRFLKIQEDVDIAEGYRPHVFYTCANVHICENLIDHLRKQKRLKEDD